VATIISRQIYPPLLEKERGRLDCEGASPLRTALFGQPDEEHMKEIIRHQIWKKLADLGLSSSSSHSIPRFKGQEQAAERLRGLEPYGKAQRVFVPPDSAQFEVRLNILRDGKVLVMATPGLKDGFYWVDQSLPQNLWASAVRSFGVGKWSKKLATNKDDVGEIDLLVTGAVAVSPGGQRIGKGTGYFDWEYAILREIGSINAETPVVALVHDLQIYDELPYEEKDVSVDFIVTPRRIIKVQSPPPRPSGIDWHKLNERTIAAMRPLREIAPR
jgi:5-formyltetrahydrofolate cyclo-ligase